ncbi:MAG: AraC family transcriptional regulator [Lachnospiraceae bacterium]|nr:AraC family transcriptional regulator [Lachnospiraceae bacterium]
MKATSSYPKIVTDETIRERVSHGEESYPFAFYLEDIWEFDFHSIDWHWHPELEFVYIEKGTAIVYAGNNKYCLTPGSAIFINKQIIHRFESTESTIIPNIVFSPFLLAAEESLVYQKYMKPILSSSIDCQIFAPNVPWHKEIIDILNRVFLLQKQENSCELQTIQLLLNLWQILYHNIKSIATEFSNKADIQDQARLQIMMQYIHENYQNNISLEELTQIISLSKSSILNIFNEYVHMSPIDYVIHYKLKQAAQLLDTTENTITAIALNTGFSNVGYFCRKFKEIFKLTPSQYRKSKHESTFTL